MKGFLTAALATLLLAGSAAASGFCPGDCDDGGEVTVDEIIRGIPMLFGDAEISTCPALDADLSGSITVVEIIQAVNSLLNGCPASPTACNGADELCDRRFDQVSYVTTHNAMANAEDGFRNGNQNNSVSHQLADGVRAFMLDTYFYEGAVQLCHADCAFFGHRLLIDTLNEMRVFLEDHPREVISIIFEAYATAEQTEQAFSESGIMKFVHVQPLGEQWPTLRQLIDSDKRLVVFTDRDRGALAWYHFVWDYAFETPFSFEKPADLVCTKNRGNAASSLFILNHFLTRGVGDPRLARLINFNPLFVDRAHQCMTEDERLPNFVTVDFYDIGDVFAVVDDLNGVHARY